MRFESFQIHNFRGIERARVDLAPSGAGIFTLIGLNESGKTTVLEAIQSFQLSGDETRHLYASEPSEVDPHSFIPKHEAGAFTGEVKIIATASFLPGEKARLVREAEEEAGLDIDLSSVPDTLEFHRGYTFVDSDVEKTFRTMTSKPHVKRAGQRKFRPIDWDTPEWYAYARVMARHLPDIVYFPTFLFDQPDRISLNPSGDEPVRDRVYRQVIENVAASLDKPKSVQAHIVDRLTKPESYIESVAGFWQLTRPKEEQVSAVINDMSAHLTETIFDQWSKIFDTDFKDRDIILKWSNERQEDGAYRIYISFNIQDGRQKYDISERSLGFRWFFSFLLFTIYRRAGNEGRSVLFLLDEPASNLHAKAQMQLIDSFPRIARNGSMLIYSTHSHYMINPAWLDQAFIVSNKGVQYEDFKQRKVDKNRHTDISIEKYRTFVGKNPDKTTYFQPVLDKLEVVPSHLDTLRPSVVVEGKGDYLILTYGLKVILGLDPDYTVLPTRGADHVGELVGLLLAWGTGFFLVFDDDKAGRKARDEYSTEWGINPDMVKTLGDISDDMESKKVEGMLEADDLECISKHYGLSVPPTKSQIQLYFSEKLAKGEKVEVSEKFVRRLKDFDRAARVAFSIGES